MTTDAHENGPHNQETPERQTLFEIQQAIKGMPAETQETVAELAEHFRRIVKQAPSGEGQLALALVGAEYAAQ
jgi:hypothetical protein